MITKSIEDYLETISRLRERGKAITTTNIAKGLKVSPASVTEMLQKLAKQGYLKYTPYRGVALTPKGEKIGKKVLRKHRVMEKFLRTLGFAKSRVHKEACELEHHIPNDLERAIHQRIEREKTLPPSGPNVIPLTGLMEGETCIVVDILGGFGARRRLATLGIRTNKKVRVITSQPLGGPVVVEVDRAHVAIGRGMAQKVLVEVVK